MNPRPRFHRPICAAAALGLATAVATGVTAPAATAAPPYDYACEEFRPLPENVMLEATGCQRLYANHEPSGVLFKYHGQRHWVYECESADPSPTDNTEIHGFACHSLLDDN